jgi:hypothetical protein
LISSFPIYRVEPKDRDGTDTGVDAEGRFYKYWCNHPELGHCLFKAAAPDGCTPEQRRWDWSEKVAAELGKLLGLPIARTELAIGSAQELGGYIDSLGVKLLAESRSISDFQDPKLVESCWWQNLTVEGQVEAVEISNIEAFNIAYKLRPMAAIKWLEVLARIEIEDIRVIFEQLPAGRIDKVTSRFAIDLLDFNRQNLLSRSELLVIAQTNIDVQEDWER